MSHRLQEWVTRSPELEDEVAIANIALDLLGQARLLLARAGAADPGRRERLAAGAEATADEDAFAYFRDAEDFRNVAFVEDPNPDFAHLVARVTVFATWRLGLLQRLLPSLDPVLAAIAEKGVKEVAYHRDYAGRWVVRLGDGTAVSAERMQAAVDAVWPRAGELLVPTDVERRLVEAGIAADPADVRGDLDAVLAQLTEAGGLRPPRPVPASDLRGREGRHSAHLTDLLAELQGLARAHPGATW
jgi:ring-1,2-phenylacetyl-CoA epoxidase subunit PaaC